MSDEEAFCNGPGAAAVLAAGIGGLALGLLALAGDAFPAVAGALNVWKPTGPLSGVTGAAIVIWLATWLVLGAAWRRRKLSMGPVAGATAVMMIAGLLLTFPPFMDFLQGK